MPIPRSITQPKTLDQDVQTFFCAGKEYFIVPDKMCASRVERLLELAPTLKLGFELANMHDFIMRSYEDMCNIEKLGDVAKIITRFANALKASDDPRKLSKVQTEAVYEICALFMISEGEDMTKIDTLHMSKKIEDFRSEMDFLSLFFFAVRQTTMFSRS